MSWPWAINSARVGTAKSGVPMNARRSGISSRRLFELLGLGELLDRHAALQARQMIDEQHPVQVIHLMLQAGGQHAVGFQLHLLAIKIEILGLDAGGALHVV